MELLEVLDSNGRLVPSPPAHTRVFGVSPWLFRQLSLDAMSWLAAAATFRSTDAFYYSNQVRYLGAYVRERLARSFGTTSAVK
jgi:hypothetical protein